MSDKVPEYAIILAFDVNVSIEAQALAEKNDIKIFCSDIIYDLQNRFKLYLQDVKKRQHELYAENVIFPVVLEILLVINRKNPIILGIRVKQGKLYLKTILVAIQEDGKHTDIGRVTSIENKGIEQKDAEQGQEVSVKIELPSNSSVIVEYNRHFTKNNLLASKITRNSIDILKKYFIEKVTSTDLKLLRKLKKIFNII